MLRSCVLYCRIFQLMRIPKSLTHFYELLIVFDERTGAPICTPETETLSLGELKELEGQRRAAMRKCNITTYRYVSLCSQRFSQYGDCS